MNSRSLPYKENENPFAFDTELAQLEGRRPNRETPFSFFGDDRADDTTTVPDRAVTRDSNSSKLIRLQRCNIALRLATCVFCLTTILLIVLARQTKSGIALTNGKTGSGTATYKFSGTFKYVQSTLLLNLSSGPSEIIHLPCFSFNYCSRCIVFGFDGREMGIPDNGLKTADIMELRINLLNRLKF